MLRRLIAALALGGAGLALAASAGSAGAASLGSCGWEARSDPVLLNVLYPDQDATYWVAALPAPPPGVDYVIHGQFPHARYTSFVAYNGLPMDHLADTQIAPDPGSTNPFVVGADRTITSRDYTVRLIDQPAPADPSQRVPNALYVGGGENGTPAAGFYLMYRVYVPDRGTDIRGNVPLPAIDAETAGGQTDDLSAASCEAVRDAVDATGVAGANQQLATTSEPVAPPASNDGSPPQWQISSGLANGAAAGTAGVSQLVSGGPGSNPDNTYIVAKISRAYGPVLVIHGQAPTTPATFDGQPVMGSGQLRYWSFCQNSRTTRFIACLSDHEVALNPDGSYTIALSDPSDRPASAANWIPFGPEPEAQLIYRQMLPSPDFYPYSAADILATGADVKQTMGPYYPQAVYCTTTQFEQNQCGFQGSS